jgi:tetratricopeptide (TPR) repeat protein
MIQISSTTNPRIQPRHSRSLSVPKVETALGTAYMNMALVFLELGRLDEALDWDNRAIAQLEKARTLDRSLVEVAASLAFVNANRARALFEKKRFAESAAAWGRARTLFALLSQSLLEFLRIPAKSRGTGLDPSDRYRALYAKAASEADNYLAVAMPGGSSLYRLATTYARASLAVANNPKCATPSVPRFRIALRPTPSRCSVGPGTAVNSGSPPGERDCSTTRTSRRSADWRASAHSSARSKTAGASRGARKAQRGVRTNRCASALSGPCPQSQCDWNPRGTPRGERRRSAIQRSRNGQSTVSVVARSPVRVGRSESH